MVLAAVEIPEVEAKSEAGDDHAGNAHGNENYGPQHVTIGLATTTKCSEEQIDIEATFSFLSFRVTTGDTNRLILCLVLSVINKFSILSQTITKLDLRCYIVKLRIQGCRYWV